MYSMCIYVYVVAVYVFILLVYIRCFYDGYEIMESNLINLYFPLPLILSILGNTSQYQATKRSG